MELATSTETVNFNLIDPITACNFGVDDEFVRQLDEGHSCFIVEIDGKKKIVIVDNCDSCFHISPLITQSDYYFCGAYNSEFFSGKSWIKPYDWQQSVDLEYYRKKYKLVIDKYGHHFDKVKKFIPMPPYMSCLGKVRRFEKLLKVSQRSRIKIATTLKFKSPFVYHKEELFAYKLRYWQFINYRKNKLKYDVVAFDTLWAWPYHRILLHKKLKQLSDDYKVISRLMPPSISVNADNKQLYAGDSCYYQYELTNSMNHNKLIKDSYERMITSSRLNIYATGKHWGWRQIMFISLLCGVPVLIDKPLYEPYFDFNEFIIFYNEKEWENTEGILKNISDIGWYKIKKWNQSIFNKYLSPVAVGKYIIKSINQ